VAMTPASYWSSSAMVSPCWITRAVAALSGHVRRRVR
jgi:hypothetical protein